MPNGDGLLVLGQTLFVVQNRASERFDVPTTVAAVDDLLYLPNARFGTEATPDTEYNAVAIARP